MSDLQRFYDWIGRAPSLFELHEPMVDLQHLPHTHHPLEPYQGNSRLGFLYQHLCTEKLSHSDRYQLELQEVQIQAPTGQTIGAIDLILRDTQLNQFEHWEVAIKFYLLHQSLWYGPNARDRLDKKLKRMLSHQLAMSSTDIFCARYPHLTNITERLLIQGRLYTNPFEPETIPKHCLGYELNPSQINGFWCYQHRFHQIDQPLYRLEKPLWACGRTDFTQPIASPTGRFTHAQTRDGVFWFIVRDCWPNDR